ncbi:unnamed protein product [Heligmosomoides polygyrus]|uniref:Peptidase S1 domain-containing protein n=1 Tax=Heligmosomoides polygyrus TaxID=6339 RepID=A0A183GIX2_HELPZ|nr:unnamed protein product [Heligmosomoides polygyrus]
MQETRTTSGVGISVFERLRDSIVFVERFDDRLMKIVVVAKERLYHFFSEYAQQAACSDQAKDEFGWSLFDEKTAEVKDYVAGENRCSGVIISRHHILTAAHCFVKESQCLTGPELR